MKHFASPKIGRFLLSIFLGFLVTISISALATDGHSAKATVQVISAPYISAPAQDRQNLTIAQSTTQKSLLQTGIQLYEAERFSEAINVWNQALTASADTANSLNQALLLSNLSLAYQHLGQLTSAEETITKSLALLENLADFSDASTYSETLAKALNTQGRLQWTTGDIESALATWRQATAAYRQADQERGILLSLLNQAKALQTLGFHLQSQAILENEVPPLLQDSQLEPQLKATGWWHLGNAQRQFGELDDSKKSLEKSLDILQREESQSLQGSILLDLGNTERALGNSANAIGMREEAQGHRERALEIYQQIARSTPDSLNGLQATLNQLSLRIESKQLSEANRLWPDILPGLEQLSPSRTGIYAQLNFANSLIQLMEAIAAEEQPKSISAKQAVASGPTWEKIDAILVRAIGQAKSLDDPIAESYGIGQRGRLYESRKQWSMAKKLTQKALRLTELNSYPDGRYRWEWQLGRVLTQQGQKNEAIQVYQAAVKTLDSVRADLRFFNAEVQFSFRDNVEPVYRELVTLLVSIDEDMPEPRQENLAQAIEQIDKLQLSELENFLQCSLAQTTAINQFEADANTAILYPMILDDRLIVILQLSDGQRKFSAVRIPHAEVETTLQQLRSDLSATNRTPKVIKTAKTVYQWLIEPFESELQAQSQIDTLVFVLDGALRNIPMAVLHDGEGYLIEKYAIAIAPELELFTPSPLPADLKVFTGGVGTPQEIEGLSFSEIKKLDEELQEVSKLVGSQPPVINQEFNRATLQEQLGMGSFSGIHIKTHGVFSSDPDATFIVAHGELLRGQQLGDLIQTTSLQGDTPIELLVLSSCSTATGDDRAVLGLAGIAVQSGARSTLSTLWDAQDEPNTQLMIRFYQELKEEPGLTRAQALQRAQLALKNEIGYLAPHIWATYVLVGNWL